MTAAPASRRLLAIQACAWLIALTSALASAVECENPTRLRFSFVPGSNTHASVEQFHPLMQRVQTLTGKPVITISSVSYSAVIEGLASGNIDFALLGAASYVTAKKTVPNITAFASYTKKGGAYDSNGAFYNALLITKSSRGISNIAALRGTTVALTDPQSTSGAIIPRHTFPKSSGQPLESYFGKIVYAGDHTHAALAVLRGQVDAAFVASSNLSSLVRAGEIKPDDFKVIWRSENIPNEPFVYRNTLCGSIKKHLITVFLKSSPAQNRSFLDAFNAGRFVPVSDADYQLIRDLQN